MQEKQKLLLEANDWKVICESPFEIQHEDGSFASRTAAYLVLNYLEELNTINSIKFDDAPLGFRFKFPYEFKDLRVWIKLSNNTCVLQAENPKLQIIKTLNEEELKNLKVIRYEY